MKVRIPSQFEVGYEFDAKDIKEATTLEYRTFLKEAGYADLDRTPNLFVSKEVLKIDKTVREAAKRAKINLRGNDGDYVVNINHTDARKLVENLDGKILTVNLMYNLFIPYIKQLAEQGNTEAKATLYEMVNTKAEWLEDLVLNKNKIEIGTKKKELKLPQENGRFDRQDLNEFGYPNSVKDNGQFYYFNPKSNSQAVIRIRNSELSLNLGGDPFIDGDRLGVRRAKFLGV